VEYMATTSEMLTTTTIKTSFSAKTAQSITNKCIFESINPAHRRRVQNIKRNQFPFHVSVVAAAHSYSPLLARAFGPSRRIVARGQRVAVERFPGSRAA